MLIFVVDAAGKPLQPTEPARARKLVRLGRATPFWKNGFFCIRLNRIVDDTKTNVTLGVDPGSKFNGYTLVTSQKVILNFQFDSITDVSSKVDAKRSYRRARRFRNTPYRKRRSHQHAERTLPPSIKARWDSHLRIIRMFLKVCPIDTVAFEDVSAKTRKGARKWNINFSPLEVGKNYCYGEIRKLGLILNTFKGYETKLQRDYRGYKKTSAKGSKEWGAHCVDSHSLCEMVEGNIEPEYKVFFCTWLKWHRRKLHKGYSKSHTRRDYGSTRSLGFRRGTLVHHPRWGKTYIGGNSKGKLSLHCISSGKRLTRCVKPSDLKVKTNLKFKIEIYS